MLGHLSRLRERGATTVGRQGCKRAVLLGGEQLDGRLAVQTAEGVPPREEESRGCEAVPAEVTRLEHLDVDPWVGGERGGERAPFNRTADISTSVGAHEEQGSGGYLPPLGQGSLRGASEDVGQVGAGELGVGELTAAHEHVTGGDVRQPESPSIPPCRAVVGVGAGPTREGHCRTGVLGQ